MYNTIKKTFPSFSNELILDIDTLEPIAAAVELLQNIEKNGCHRASTKRDKLHFR